MADKKVKFFWTGLDKPKDGKIKDGKIEIKTPPQTHVWRKTDTDGNTANAPFYFRKIKGDFECTVKVTSKTKMATWLDQCGILFQEKRGIYAKIALEYQQPPREDGLKYYVAAYVHTADMLESPENKTPYPGQFSTGDKNYSCLMLEEGQQKDLWLRLSRLEGFIEAEYSFDGEEWKQLKAARFSTAEIFSAGVFSSSPGADGAGFKAVMSDFHIEETEYVDDDEEEEGEEAEDVAEEPALAEESAPAEEVEEEAEAEEVAEEPPAEEAAVEEEDKE